MFSLIPEGKNNTVTDALTQISKEYLFDEEADKLFEMVPMIPGDHTVIEVFEEEEDGEPEKAVPHTMSSAAMKAL